jgi:YD repeat-containing protein
MTNRDSHDLAITTLETLNGGGSRTVQITAPDNAYTLAQYQAGWLKERTGERGIKTVYAYINADVASVTYSDGGATPSVSYTYDRRGRMRTVTRNNITTTLTYNDSGQLLEEANSGGPLSGLKVANHYDALLRRTNVQALVMSPFTILASTNLDSYPTPMQPKGGG